MTRRTNCHSQRDFQWDKKRNFEFSVGILKFSLEWNSFTFCTITFFTLLIIFYAIFSVQYKIHQVTSADRNVNIMIKDSKIEDWRVVAIVKKSFWNVFSLFEMWIDMVMRVSHEKVLENVCAVFSPFFVSFNVIFQQIEAIELWTILLSRTSSVFLK